MQIDYEIQNRPNKGELENLFELAFGDNDDLSEDNHQSLSEWFSVEGLVHYLPFGELIEARSEDGKLVGAVFTAKQNPATFPDGRKWEVFILGVLPEYSGYGIGTELVKRAESAAKVCGAKSMVINTHHEAVELHQWYQKLGYQQIGQLENYYDNGHAVFFKKKL